MLLMLAEYTPCSGEGVLWSRLAALVEFCLGCLARARRSIWLHPLPSRQSIECLLPDNLMR